MKNSVAKSILLVEDDPDDQELFQLALQEVDASVVLVKASDGLDALAKLAQIVNIPDLIVLDINMPRMNGRDFLITIKGDPTLRNIPVVLYSTTSESNYVREIIASGARSFFKKPDNFAMLCSELRNTISC